MKYICADHFNETLTCFGVHVKLTAGMPTAQPVSLYIITFNDADNLRAVLPTVLWADEVVVADSFSTDDTAAICAQFGVRHVNIKFEGFGKFRNDTLALLQHDWVVSIDSDERSTLEFAEEVRRTLVAPPHAAFFVPRRNTFLGWPVNFGGMYPDYRQPQVFDRRKLRYREDPVHESFHCDGTIGFFKNSIWQHPWPTLKVIMQKGDRYTTLVARQRFEKGNAPASRSFWDIRPSRFSKNIFSSKASATACPG